MSEHQEPRVSAENVATCLSGSLETAIDPENGYSRIRTVTRLRPMMTDTEPTRAPSKAGWWVFRKRVVRRLTAASTTKRTFNAPGTNESALVTRSFRSATRSFTCDTAEL